MKITRIDIKRNDTALELTAWPCAAEFSGVVSSQIELAIQPANNVTVLNVSAHASASVPVCQDGVCQLGDWKPQRKAA
jgi:hypothetical protein